ILPSPNSAREPLASITCCGVWQSLRPRPSVDCSGRFLRRHHLSWRACLVSSALSLSWPPYETIIKLQTKETEIMLTQYSSTLSDHVKIARDRLYLMTL